MKNLIKNSRKFLALACLAISVSAMPLMPAQAGVLELLFPSIKPKAPQPEETLQAPFSYEEDAAQAQGNALLNLKPKSEGIDSLDKSHRVSDEIGQWLTDVISESLTFKGAAAQVDLDQTALHFDAFGRQQYTEFLQTNNIMKALESGRYRVSSYVDGVPLLLNQGAVDGRHRWLFRANAVISYLDRTAESYEGVEPINQRASLDIQIGRSSDAKGADGIWIERWSGKMSTVKAK